MSDKNQARRTTAEVVFGGTDITSSIRPYFLSMTYTDNEEDEADDLFGQIIDAYPDTDYAVMSREQRGY